MLSSTSLQFLIPGFRFFSRHNILHKRLEIFEKSHEFFSFFVPFGFQILSVLLSCFSIKSYIKFVSPIQILFLTATCRIPLLVATPSLVSLLLGLKVKCSVFHHITTLPHFFWNNCEKITNRTDFTYILVQFLIFILFPVFSHLFGEIF